MRNDEKKRSWLAPLSLALLLALGSGAAIAQERQHVDGEGYSMDVTLDRGANKAYVDVKRARSRQDLPRGDVMLTLFDDRGTGEAIRLKAMEPGAAFPKFMGELSRSPESYVGFEIRFETSLKAVKVLRSMPRVPSGNSKP